MLNRMIIAAFLALLALAVPTAASASSVRTGAVVFSRVSKEGGIAKGGLFAAKEGRLNQLTENPGDSQPNFSSDGRTIAFARDGDIYSVRADGSGERVLTSGAAIDERPVVSPNGKVVLFERRAATGAARDLYTVRATGGSAHALTTSAADEHEASFSDDGCMIAFVRSFAEPGGGTRDDLFSIRPAGIKLRRLTNTPGVDEFAPHYFADENIVFSRGQSGEGADAYADVYTMRENGSHVKPLVRGAGSAFVEDVAPSGHELLFRRDRGLWVKRIGPGRAHKLTELPDGSKTNSVFSSNGRSVAAFVAGEEEESLSAIDVASHRLTNLAEGFDPSEGGSATTIGPVIAWQPVRH
jgi:Tol biopolymer transport system component